MWENWCFRSSLNWSIIKVHSSINPRVLFYHVIWNILMGKNPHRIQTPWKETSFMKDSRNCWFFVRSSCTPCFGGIFFVVFWGFFVLFLFFAFLFFCFFAFVVRPMESERSPYKSLLLRVKNELISSLMPRSKHITT